MKGKQGSSMFTVLYGAIVLIFMEIYSYALNRYRLYFIITTIRTIRDCNNNKSTTKKSIIP